jgi:signal transduction histidine kinase
MARRESASLMPSLMRIGSWPLAWKVPLLMAVLIVGIAILISQVVLSRLTVDQENNLRLLTSAYLDGLSAAVTPSAIRSDTWETFDALDRARSRYSGVDARYTIVELPSGKVLAASDPVRFPVQSVIPAELVSLFPAEDGLTIDNAAGRAWLARTLREEGFSVGRILAEIDIADLLRVRREVLVTLVLANAGLAAFFAVIGYFSLKRMLRPLSVLSGYVERVREGRVEPIPEGNSHGVATEFSQLFDRFNAMARALSERESLASHLAAQDKYAMLGKLASGMAHEVNNPLGGLFNALDTLRRHGADSNVRDSTLNLLQRGLNHIRNLVRSTLVIYRHEVSLNPMSAADIDDLRLLIQHEAVRKNIRLDWANEIDTQTKLPVRAESARQAILNLLINACAATPPGGGVRLWARANDDVLTIDIGDEGPGMPSELASYLVSGSNGTLRAGDGLGLWIVRRLTTAEGGSVHVLQEGAYKTIIRVALPFRQEFGSHSDTNTVSAEEAVHAE